MGGFLLSFDFIFTRRGHSSTNMTTRSQLMIRIELIRDGCAVPPTAGSPANPQHQKLTYLVRTSTQSHTSIYPSYSIPPHKPLPTPSRALFSHILNFLLLNHRLLPHTPPPLQPPRLLISLPINPHAPPKIPIPHLSSKNLLCNLATSSLLSLRSLSRPEEVQ